MMKMKTLGLAVVLAAATYPGFASLASLHR
jgi:hypothetical protein